MRDIDRKTLIVKEEMPVNDKNKRINPVGLVILEDKDGNVLLKKNNMIVDIGRRYILSLFLEKNSIIKNKVNITSENGDLETLPKYSIRYVKFGQNEQMPSPSDSNISEITGLDLEYEIKDENNNPSIGAEYTIGDDGDMYITFTTQIVLPSSSNDTYISELGLILENSETKDKKLFSRVSFDPIPISASTEFTLKYYLYF